LACAFRNAPKYIPKNFQEAYTKLSKCGVNIRFSLNRFSGIYERVPASWKSVHDHILILDDRCMLSEEVLNDIKNWWMEKPDIKIFSLIKKVRDSPKHQVITANGETHYLHLKHLDILNGLRYIYGENTTKVSVSDLM